MEQALRSYFILLLLVPVLMSALSFLKYHKYHKSEFLHLTEFYLSLAFVAVLSWFLLPMDGAYVVLSMLPWMWALRTMGLVTGDVLEQTMFKKYHFIALGIGGVISLIFLSFNFDLPMVTAPFSLSVGLIGLTFIFQAYSRGQIRSFSFLHHFNFFLVLGFFITRLIFPILISTPPSTHMASVIDTYLVLTLCASLYPLYAEVVFERHERFLEEVLHTRNRQLFTHSGFSEFRILSAGISHEINNALSMINARIAILLRRKSKDMDADLRAIQSSTNRIVRSIRGMREFIYPHEIDEVLDLGELLQEVLDIYGQRLSNHGVQVNVEGLSGKLVNGQRILFEQVFLSLINNSVDAVDKIEEKWIKVQGKAREGSVEVFYQDASGSNADEIMLLLNDPFYASHEFMDKDIRLVLAREIVQKYGGQFSCVKQSEYSTFLITMPLADAVRSTQMEFKTRLEEINERNYSCAKKRDFKPER